MMWLYRRNVKISRLSIYYVFLKVNWKKIYDIFLRGKLALMFGILPFILNCSSNCRELNDELVHLREKVHQYEDSLSSILRGNFVFQNINTLTYPIKESDDSVTYKLAIVADSLYLYTNFFGVEVNYEGNKKGKLFSEQGFNFLSYPKPKKGEIDTLKLKFQYKDEFGELIFELIDEVVVE